MRSMHATVPAGAIQLAPALALLLGLATIGALDILRAGRSVARLAALLALALALGAAIRLALLARVASLDFALAVRLGDDPTTIGWHVDALAVHCLVALLIVGLAVVNRIGSEHSARRIGVVLLTLVVATVLFGATSVDLVVGLWLIVVLIGMGDLIVAHQADKALAWASLALSVAPVMAFAGAILASSHGGVALLTFAPSPANQPAAVLLAIAGLASAGLTPLNGWLAHPTDLPIDAFIADAVLPLAGFYVAARALSLTVPEHSLAVVALVIGFGLWTVGDANQALWKVHRFPDVMREAGRGETALAFIALAVGSKFALGAATFLLAVSVIARTSSRLAGPDWLARIGWASSAGLPPLPGFVGRWLCAVAAFAAGQWLLGLAIGAAGFVLNLGLFGTRSIRVVDENPPTTIDLMLACLLVIVGLAPIRVASAVVADQSVVGPPASGLAIALLAIVVVLAPTAIAATVERSRRPSYRPAASQSIQNLYWGDVEHVAERVSEAWRVVDTRYNLPFGFLAIVVALFALMR